MIPDKYNEIFASKGRLSIFWIGLLIFTLVSNSDANSGVKSRHDKNLLLFGASERGNIAQAQTALDEGADINAKWNQYYNMTALIIASANDRLDMVKFLLSRGANTNPKTSNYGATALIIASSRGCKNIAKLLLDNGADVNDELFNGSSALIIASQTGHLDVVKLLLNYGAKIDTKRHKDGGSSIITASRNGHLDVVKLLLDRGANINEKDSVQGLTPLINASLKGHRDVVQLLLDREANIEAMRTEDGVTALMMASSHGWSNVVELLADKGAQVNRKDTLYGMTSLIAASQKGHRDVVKTLLDKGANIDERRTKDGATALFVASRNGHPDVVNLLLDKGADINVRAKDKYQMTTALGVAKRHNHKAIVKILEDAGAKEDVIRTLMNKIKAISPFMPLAFWIVFATVYGLIIKISASSLHINEITWKKGFVFGVIIIILGSFGRILDYKLGYPNIDRIVRPFLFILAGGWFFRNIGRNTEGKLLGWGGALKLTGLSWAIFFVLGALFLLVSKILLIRTMP